MTLAIGMDIGGTQLRVGVIDETANALVLERSASFSHDTPDKLIELIVNTIHGDPIASTIGNDTVVGIGIGMAGLVDAGSGIVYRSPHFPHIDHFELKKNLAAKLDNIPIYIDNDANCLALGEAWHGVARFDDFFLVALGTGIGGGIIRNGTIDHGTNGFAGEIGHICIDRNGPRCPCGSRGCWETLASGSGLVNIVAQDKKYRALATITPEKLGDELWKRAQHADSVALAVYEELGKNLAIGLGSLVSATGIHRIVLAGGLCEAKSLFFPALLADLRKWTYTHAYASPIEIRFSSLIPWGGVYGAAKLVFDAQKILS